MQSLDSWLEQTEQSLPEQDSERYVSYNILDLYPEWQEDAHCQGVGHDYYFGDDDRQPTMSIKQVRNAAKLCDVCPVFVECLRHALTVREEYGVWAGTSGRARRKLFVMLDSGEWTIEQVIEVVTHERRGAEPPRELRRNTSVASRDGLSDATPGAVSY